MRTPGCVGSSPQHHTIPVFSSAQAVDTALEIATNEWPPATAVGTSFNANDESPSWPNRLSPQQYGFASTVSAQLNCVPRAMDTIADGFAAVPGDVMSLPHPHTRAPTR